jgi:hypothetical protein
MELVRMSLAVEELRIASFAISLLGRIGLTTETIYLGRTITGTVIPATC